MNTTHHIGIFKSIMLPSGLEKPIWDGEGVPNDRYVFIHVYICIHIYIYMYIYIYIDVYIGLEKPIWDGEGVPNDR
jgi:hypothetical protein